MNTTVFKIDGMTCVGRAAIVEKAVREVPGVLAVDVEYEHGQAIVGTGLRCPVPTEQIIQALRQVGYGAQLSEFPGLK